MVHGLKGEMPQKLELKYKESAYGGGNSWHVYNLLSDDVIGLAPVPFDPPQ
jgi:hypothetical protein